MLLFYFAQFLRCYLAYQYRYRFDLKLGHDSEIARNEETSVALASVAW